MGKVATLDNQQAVLDLINTLRDNQSKLKDNTNYGHMYLAISTEISALYIVYSNLSKRGK